MLSCQFDDTVLLVMLSRSKKSSRYGLVGCKLLGLRKLYAMKFTVNLLMKTKIYGGAN